MSIVPREAVEHFGDLRRAEACIGTGPWMLQRYEPNTRLMFVRNKEYFVSGLPYADGVEVTVDEDPSSRLASWLSGRYDFAPEYGQCVRHLEIDAPHALHVLRRSDVAPEPGQYVRRVDPHRDQ